MNQRSNCQHPLNHRKSKSISEKHLLLLHCSRSWWWTGKPGLLQSMGSQRVITEWLNRLTASLTTLNKLWKILQGMGIPEHLTCFLRNLCAGQEATVRIVHGTMDWLQIGKWVHQGCILSPYLLNFYAEYIMWNARLDGAQTGIKIAGRNSNNLRYPDDSTFMGESEEERGKRTE